MQRTGSFTLKPNDYHRLLLIGLLGHHDSHKNPLNYLKLPALLSFAAGETAPSSFCPDQDLLRPHRQTRHLHNISVSRLSMSFIFSIQIILFHAERAEAFF